MRQWSAPPRTYATHLSRAGEASAKGSALPDNEGVRDGKSGNGDLVWVAMCREGQWGRRTDHAEAEKAVKARGFGRRGLRKAGREEEVTRGRREAEKRRMIE